MIFVFDVDGVLAKSRQKPCNDIALALDELAAQGHAVYACTGTGYDEIIDQVSNCSFDGIFSDSGALLNGSPHQYTPERRPYLSIHPDGLFNIVHRPYSLYLDFANGMGRERFIELDARCSIRKSVQESLQSHYPEYQFLIGGQVSIDVLIKGKECAIEYLRATYPQEKIIYIGDRCYVGGNDYLAFKAADLGVQVNDQQSVITMLRLLLGKNNDM